MNGLRLADLEGLKPLLDALAVPVVVVDLDRRVIYRNAAFSQITGVGSPPVRVGQPCPVCASGANPCIAQTCREEGRAVTRPAGELTLPGGGSPRVVAAAVPLLGEDGRPAAFLEQYVDREAEAREAREKSEILAEALRRQFQEVIQQRDELVEAHDRLRELYAEIVTLQKSVTVGALAGGIAHELNNPLTIIDGHTEMMKDAVRSLRTREVEGVERLEEWLGVIQECVARCSRITSGLLAFMRGPRSSVPVASALSDVVEEAVTLTRFHKVARTVKIDVQLPPELPRVPLIRDMAVQAVSNLLSNACQAMQGKGAIRISAARSEDGRAVELRLTDTGPGLPPEVQKNIFRPFTSTKPEGEGTGLGLFLTGFIVERHGGRIDVDSRPGQGTTFTLRWPVPDGDRVPAGEP